ncbi:hypothetical protein A2960_03020 [Candidatus Gottesmanbacteria bacterium RIFCSPLOWO2_01_FULL_39_12b]|uniref:Uncharacterized protein n=1 Tax=Candidatus Gottesmanbacteria bacterium RIFCSPLOWO2_01_FULL_39_12b TaxID=1798388 RepID=A0A1F6AS26_9BACT|nr:MAG: hypothetical protein A2960_03020 [Candidatus Gottesmanbacteria bacterium RIFCSPLOWO2_01_FULL_39_12b]
MKVPADRHSLTETSCIQHADVPVGSLGNRCRDLLDDPTKSQYRCDPGLICAPIFKDATNLILSSTYKNYLRSIYPPNESQNWEDIYVDRPNAISATKKATFFDDDKFTVTPKGVCIPLVQTQTNDCGSQGQPPCKESGKDICFNPGNDPAIQLINNICQHCGLLNEPPCTSASGVKTCTDPTHIVRYKGCQPCGGPGQIGCPAHADGPDSKCTDPNMFVWTDANKPEFYRDINDNCKPLPSREELFQYDRTGFEASGKKSVGLDVYAVNGNMFNIPDVDVDSVKDRLYTIPVYSNQPKETVAGTLFTQSVRSMSSLFDLFSIKIDELSENIDFLTRFAIYTNKNSTLDATCNGIDIKFPVYVVDNAYSVYPSFASFGIGYDRYLSLPARQQMGVDAWNKCQFKFDKDNLIKLNQLHLVFNNGGADIIYDYNLSNVANNFVKIKFVYNKR